MKKLVMIAVMFLVVFGTFALPTTSAFAKEHGGSTISEPGGGSMMKGTKDDAADLKKAADMVRATDPDLAKRLEKMAQEQCGI